jgi:hypothetical protein
MPKKYYKEGLYSEKPSKKTQMLTSTITQVLLKSEKMKGAPIINIKGTKAQTDKNTLIIYFNTLDGKHGTALDYLAKVRRDVSDALFALDIYYKPPIIKWEVLKEDENVIKVKNIIEALETNKINKIQD